MVDSNTSTLDLAHQIPPAVLLPRGYSSIALLRYFSHSDVLRTETDNPIVKWSYRNIIATIILNKPSEFNSVNILIWPQPYCNGDLPKFNFQRFTQPETVWDTIVLFRKHLGNPPTVLSSHHELSIEYSSRIPMVICSAVPPILDPAS